MTVDVERYERALDVAAAEARRWLRSIPIHPVPATPGVVAAEETAGA